MLKPHTLHQFPCKIDCMHKSYIRGYPDTETLDVLPGLKPIAFAYSVNRLALPKAGAGKLLGARAGCCICEQLGGLSAKLARVSFVKD